MAEASDYHPGKGTLIAGVFSVAATYVFFLLFAEFALVEMVRASAGENVFRLRQVMGLLAVGGVAGGFLAAWRFRLERYPRQLANAFRACGASAALALAPHNHVTWLATAACVGLALGWLTVTLASGLRATLGASRLGVCCGLGTGLAYAVCNVPVVFAAAPATQAIIAAIIAGLASVVGPFMTPFEPSVATDDDYRGNGILAWIALFLALVWMDSAAFYVIQHTDTLRADTWQGAATLWGNAVMHAVAAVVAGWALDRGRRVSVVLVGFLLLAVACVLLGAGHVALSVWLYTAGVSFYSVALVYYPSLGGRARFPAMVFGIAGWGGSAMGIGMAQDLHQVPLSFVGAAAIVVVAALVVRGRAVRTVVGGLVLLGVVGAGDDARASEILRGRDVYIAEGCLHCHSQYVRPNTADVAMWGPAQPLSEALDAAPPLLGNRRQGPDLTNVGVRRSPEWNRLHLIAPRQVSPGSRMPSYAYLFKAGDARGPALVAYLESLGAARFGEWLEMGSTWSPVATAWRDVRADAVHGAGLFARLCVGCHGEGGRGDGVLAARLSQRPPDLTSASWRRPRLAESDEAVARAIKWGFPGTPMAGHEYLRDAEVVALTRYVRGLHGTGAKR